MTKSNRKPSSRFSLAANLRAARALFGWSQEELALECGLKRTYVGALERTEINPGIDNVDKLALGLGLFPHTLLLAPADAYSAIYTAVSLWRRDARR
jgi:transcriptional regulator with XRE-family HTH domain